MRLATKLPSLELPNPEVVTFVAMVATVEQQHLSCSSMNGKEKEEGVSRFQKLGLAFDLIGQAQVGWERNRVSHDENAVKKLLGQTQMGFCKKEVL